MNSTSYRGPTPLRPHFAPRRVLVEATTPQAAVEAAAAAIDREGEGENKGAPDEP